MNATAEINKKLSQIWGKQPEQMIEKTIEAEIVQQKSFLPPQNIVNYYKAKTKAKVTSLAQAPLSTRVEIPPRKQKQCKAKYNKESIENAAEFLGIGKTRVYILLWNGKLKSHDGFITADSLSLVKQTRDQNIKERVLRLKIDRYNNTKRSTDTHLNSKDAADYLGLGIKTIYNYVSKNKLKSTDGLIAIEELERFKIKDKYKLSEAMKAMENEEVKAMKSEEVKMNSEDAKDPINPNYYTDMKIAPSDYIWKNNIPYLEGNVIKYISRHKGKNGAEDIKKAIKYCEMILELEYGEKVG